MTSTSRTPAQAAASRRNGARSRGPRTPAGKARAARNALRHGLRARRLVLIEGEDIRAFEAFTASVQAELAPLGTLQAELAARVAVAAWRARRADRLEAALLGCHLPPGAAGDEAQTMLGSGLIRDGHGPRAFETLLRYRGAVLSELFRALAALRALQAQSVDPAAGGAEVLPPAPEAKTKRTRERI